MGAQGPRRSGALSLAAPLREAGVPFATFDAPAHGLSSGSTASVPVFAAALRVLHPAEVAEAVGAFLIEQVGGGEAPCESPDCDGVVTRTRPGERRLCASCALDAQLFAPALRTLGTA